MSGDEEGSAQPIRYTPRNSCNPEHVTIRANGPGALVLTDAYHRGWRAYVDGREVAVYIANYVSRGVGLPAGPHSVEFVFDPLSWRLGRALSLAALAFGMSVMSVAIWSAIRRRDDHNQPRSDNGASTEV